MQMSIVFKIIFWWGILVSIASLFVPLAYFLPLLLLGVVSLCYSLFEQHLWKQAEKLPQVQQLPLPDSSFLAKQKSLPVTKTLRFLRKQEAAPKRHFFAKFKHLFKKQPAPQTYEPKIRHDFLKDVPHYERVKQLFAASTQPVGVPPQNKPPPALQQVMAKRFTKTPLQPQQHLFPWEKEEHYVPTGAEYLLPEHEPREAVAAIPDERYSTPAETGIRQALQPPGTFQATAPSIPFQKVITPPKTGIREAQPEVFQHQQKVITAPPPKQPPERPKQEPSPLSKNAQALAQLQAYVRASLAAHYPSEHIKVAALQVGWPEEMVQQAFQGMGVAKKKKQLFILGGMVLLLFVLLLVLAFSSDLLLFPYLLESLYYAPLGYSLGALVVLLLVLFIFAFKIKNLLKEKKILHKQVETQHVAEIKSELAAQKKGFQTDFDRLYQLVKEKKKIPISEVAQGFGIARSKAEEWGKILKEEGLIELYYPTVGEPELQWKK